jgi:integrase/recombinase XerD
MIRIHGKGDRIRIRPLRTRAWKALANYLKKDGRLKYKNSEPLIVTENRKRLHPSAIYDVVSKLGRRAGLKRKLHPHLLRHKFASLAIESGVELTSVQADLGHASIDTTAMYDSSKTDPRRSAALRMKDPLDQPRRS